MSVTEFYRLEATKLIADSEKISLFTKHPGTLGAFREARLREYLTEHVPARFAVTSGFITDHGRAGANLYDHSSRQIDCLVHDASQSAPLLRTDEFAIVTPSPVAAFVEVKSTLTLSKRTLGEKEDGGFVEGNRRYAWAGTLVDALENLKSAIAIMDEAQICRSTYFAGIIAYDANSLPTFVEAMTSGELFGQLDVEDLDQLPDCICILNGPAWTFSMSGEDDPETNGLGDTDPDYSFAIEFPQLKVGSSLQMFTAFFDNALSVERLEQDHVLGGLRSGAGYDGAWNPHKVAVPCPRQHGSGCCESVQDGVGWKNVCSRRQKRKDKVSQQGAT